MSHGSRASLDIAERSVGGFLVGGQARSSVFMGRINEPCRHQPCPYALVRLTLSGSAQAARNHYLARNKNCSRKVLRAAGYVIYNVRLPDFVTASVTGNAARALLLELCHGRAEGNAWQLFRDLRDHRDVQVMTFPSRNSLRDVLVLQSEVSRVELGDVGPLLI